MRQVVLLVFVELWVLRPAYHLHLVFLGHSVDVFSQRVLVKAITGQPAVVVASKSACGAIRQNADGGAR